MTGESDRRPLRRLIGTSGKVRMQRWINRLEAVNHAVGSTVRWLALAMVLVGSYNAIVRYLGNPADKQESLKSKRAGGYQALDVMEQHLGKHAFFANDRYSIADIALFAYTRTHRGAEQHRVHFDADVSERILDDVDRDRIDVDSLERSRVCFNDCCWHVELPPTPG